MIALHTGSAKVQIVPQMGAGHAGNWAVLRPWSGDQTAGPFALGSFLIVPFFDRISHSSFQFEGTGQRVSPNLPGQAYPIHGDGFQRELLQVDVSPHSARLMLANGKSARSEMPRQ